MKKISIILLGIIAIGLLAMLFSGCSKKSILKKYCVNTNDTIRVHDTVQVILPPDTVGFTLQIDSLQKKLNLLETLQNKHTSVVIYDDSLMQLTAKYDAQTRQLKWQLANKKPKTIEVPVEVEVIRPCKCPTLELTWGQLHWQYFLVISILLLLLVVAAIIWK